jgi:protein TonB
MSSPIAVSHFSEERVNGETHRRLGYGFALLASTVLHGLIWQTRHEFDRDPPPKPLESVIEVSLVAPAPPTAVKESAPVPHPPAPIPEETKLPPVPKIKPHSEDKPKTKQQPKLPAKPKVVLKPRREMVEKPAISADQAEKTVTTETPIESTESDTAASNSSMHTSQKTSVPTHSDSESFVEARADAAYLHNPKPEYPSMARQRFLEGKVILRVQVLADGRSGHVSVERSSGHETLDEVALATVRQWRFVPAKRGDRAVESWVNVPIVFKLNR